jgi:Zn-finger protein
MTSNQESLHAIRQAVAESCGVEHRSNQYPELPSTLPTYVEPALAGCAHVVFDGSFDENNDETLGYIYLGPQASASSFRMSALAERNIGGIVNCTSTFPCHFQDDSDKIQYCKVLVNDGVGADILTFLEVPLGFCMKCSLTRKEVSWFTVKWECLVLPP